MKRDSTRLTVTAETLPEASVFGRPADEVRDPRFAELDAQIAQEQAARRTKRASRQRSTGDAAMSQVGGPRSSLPSPAVPKVGPPRKRALPPLLDGPRQIIEIAAQQVREKHGSVDREIGDRLARLFRTLITPRRKTGRPMTHSVAIAVDLRQKKWPWPEIYPAAIPGYQRMEFYEKSYRKARLREAFRAHRRRRRKRTPSS